MKRILLSALALALIFPLTSAFALSASFPCISDDGTHQYTNSCDGTCDLCGAKRVTLGHIYEDECYPDCNFCGERRTVTHQYTSDCDELCNLCGRRRAVTHTFTDDADLDCDVCGAKRPFFLVGDLDRNDSLDLDDAIYALYHVNFPDAYPVSQSIDFDGNEKNDLNDAIHLLYHVNFPHNYPLNKGFYLHWPLAKEHTGTVTGSTTLNNFFVDIDVGGWANNGKIPALAAEDGTVVRSGYFSDWGNLVVVDHGNGYQTYYAHLDSASVSVGERVLAGEELGKIGATGNTTTVKLRLILYAPVGSGGASVRVDPLAFIKKP